MLPYYISLGMSPEQFWNGDPYLAVVYRDVANRKAEEQNSYLWLQGRYIYEAVEAVVHNHFARKGTKAKNYPNEPYRITPQTEDELKQAKERERQKAIDSLNRWKAAWDKTHA